MGGLWRGEGGCGRCLKLETEQFLRVGVSAESSEVQWPTEKSEEEERGEGEEERGGILAALLSHDG